MVSFNNPVDEKREVALTSPTTGESFVFRSFAYLRCRGKSIAGRGSPVAFVIRDGGVGPSATLSLNGQPAPITAADGRLRYGK